MTEVKLEGLYANQIYEIVYELKSHGLVQGIDFEWYYYKPTYNAYQLEHDRKTIFKFYRAETATWFSLIWA